MKKLIPVFLAILLLTSCTKKDDPTPVLTGTWDKLFTFTSGRTFNGIMVLTQNGSSLTGNFVISDNSGYAQLLSTSKITGNAVTIDWKMEGIDLTLNFQGTVNTTYDSMSGLFYSNDIKMGTWLANKKQ